MYDNDNEEFQVDSNGCFSCDTVPKVKGRFGLAWVSESPDCPYPEPVGWQVEFLDTPSKVEQKCQEMVRWINCPPLPRCDPSPPEELCCTLNKKKKCPCKKSDQRRSAPQNYNNNGHDRQRKCCCCCSNQDAGRPKRNCYPPMGGPCPRKKSRSPARCSPCNMRLN